MTSNTFLALGAILALSSSCVSAFFLGWGSSDQTSPAPTHYIYHRRLIQSPAPAYVIENNQRQQIPSVPVQVPLQAQLSPISNVHNVQLVPCLCPVSQEYPYDNQPIPQENFYVNGLPVQQIPQQLPPPQQIVQQQKP